MQKPLQSAAIALVKLPVTDFERARHFYRDVLGLSEDFAVEEYGWAQFATGSIPLCLFVSGKGGGDAAGGGDSGIQLRIANAAIAYEQLAEFVEGDLEVGDDGSKSFLLRDPDGNGLQVLQLA